MDRKGRQEKKIEGNKKRTEIKRKNEEEEEEGILIEVGKILGNLD